MQVLTPLKAIRGKCRDCTCDQVLEIRECPIKTCTLWPYRMGKRPRQGVGTPRAFSVGETFSRTGGDTLKDLKLIKTAYFQGVRCDFWQDENGEVYMTEDQVMEALGYERVSGAEGASTKGTSQTALSLVKK